MSNNGPTKKEMVEAMRRLEMMSIRPDDVMKRFLFSSETLAIDPGRVFQIARVDVEKSRELNSRQQLESASEKIKELTEILETIKKEPLLLRTIDRMSKDKKHAFTKKGDQDIRIESVKNLEAGDEVLLHPKTFQIVEHLGKPPLEVSRFAPDRVPNVTWDDIGGLEEAKADLIEAIEMPHAHKDLFDFYGKRQIKGVLLSGPPGCGKTMLGKAAANSLAKIYEKKNTRTGFLYVKGPEILNQYVGQTEQTIRDIFYDAKRHKMEHGYPAIIFLDEADAILASRGTRSVGIGNTIVPMFLTEMDGLEESGAIVIIATNRPDVLDPAIVRDGRIDRKVVVTRPDKANAAKIIQLGLARTKMESEINPAEVAALLYADDCKLADGTPLSSVINGAMLENCLSIAVSSAISRDIAAGTRTGITMADIRQSVARLQKQTSGLRHDLHHDAPSMIVAVPVPIPVGGNSEAGAVDMMKKGKLN